MEAATALINGLGGERQRWTQQEKEFQDEIIKLTGNCATSAAFLTYLGPFNKEFRDAIYHHFFRDCMDRKLPITVDSTVTKFLTDETETGGWNLQGLPTDELSTQNGVLFTRSVRVPLLVDPHGQGRIWITTREAQSGLRVTTFQERNFRLAIEMAILEGKPLLIENVEETIDNVLDPILDKQMIKGAKGWKILIMDKELDYCETFSLCMTSKLSNPHFTPELSARLTIIDFTVTMYGLEDQLLGRVIEKVLNQTPDPLNPTLKSFSLDRSPTLPRLATCRCGLTPGPPSGRVPLRVSRIVKSAYRKWAHPATSAPGRGASSRRAGEAGASGAAPQTDDRSAKLPQQD